jgi:hypothetical protein
MAEGWMNRLLARLVACAACLSSAAGSLHAQAPAPSEYEVKAAYLYNFGKFVEWPASQRRTARTFDVCVLGTDPFGEALDRVVAGAVVAGKAVRARRLLTAAEAPGCHILFVGTNDDRQITEVLGILNRADVLTVSDGPQFVRRGGMIQFVRQGSRVRFEVNLARAQEARLVLSSELLRVATTVLKD